MNNRKSQRDALLDLILGKTPYTKESDKYWMMRKDLDQLQYDTLLILNQNMRAK